MNTFSVRFGLGCLLFVHTANAKIAGFSPISGDLCLILVLDKPNEIVYTIYSHNKTGEKIMNLKDAQKYRIEKSTTGKIEHKIKKSVLGVNQHQVIVKTDTATNTGPVQMFNRPITVKYGHLIQWLTHPQNQKFEIIRIITVEAK